MKFLLASNSRGGGAPFEVVPAFEVVPSRFEEIAKAEEGGKDRCLRFAEGKAREVFSRFPDAAVLGADTVVCMGGEILGKPKDEADAFQMLRLLSGKTHSVYTGCALSRPKGKEAASKRLASPSAPFGRGDLILHQNGLPARQGGRLRHSGQRLCLFLRGQLFERRGASPRTRA